MTNDQGEYPEMMTYIFWNLILVAKTLNNNVDAVVNVDVVVECWCCVTCYNMNHHDSMIVFRNNYWISSILWLCETHRHLFEDWVANQGQTAEFANENNWWRLLWMLQGKREYIKHCQRHNGPQGWVHLAKVTSWGHITSSDTNLDHISSSESRLSIH